MLYFHEFVILRISWSGNLAKVYFERVDSGRQSSERRDPDERHGAQRTFQVRTPLRAEGHRRTPLAVARRARDRRAAAAVRRAVAGERLAGSTTTSSFSPAIRRTGTSTASAATSGVGSKAPRGTFGFPSWSRISPGRCRTPPNAPSSRRSASHRGLFCSARPSAMLRHSRAAAGEPLGAALHRDLHGGARPVIQPGRRDLPFQRRRRDRARGHPGRGQAADRFSDHRPQRRRDETGRPERRAPALASPERRGTRVQLGSRHRGLHRLIEGNGAQERFEITTQSHGETFHVGVSLTQMGDLICASLTDVTALKLREESYRLLFDANPMPMWIVDGETRAFPGGERRRGRSTTATPAIASST